jgi:hypothetical protein
MQRTLLALKSRVSPGDRKSANQNKIGRRQRWTMPGPPVSYWQTSEAEESMFQVFKLRVLSQSKLLILSRSGSLAPNNVLFINVSQKTKGNKTDCQDLVTRIVQLLDPRHFKIRTQQTSIGVLRRILNDSLSMYRVLVINIAYLRCPKGLGEDSRHLKAASRSKHHCESRQFRR